MILTTPTALKIDGIATWIHYTHTRLADPEIEDPTDSFQKKGPSGGVEYQDNLLKFKLSRHPP